MSEKSESKLSKHDKQAVITVWLIILVDLLGFGIVLPSLAYYVDLFDTPAWASSLGNMLGFDVHRGGVLVGVIMTVYSGCQFLFSPVWGRLSDRVGRRPILAMSTLGFSLTWVLFALSPSFFWLLVSRALAGAFGANLSTAQACMADVFPPEKRAKGMGLIGMAFGVGFVFGPAIGALLVSDTVLDALFEHGTETWRHAHLFLPAFFAAALSGISFLMTIFRMRETLPESVRNNPKPRVGRVAQLMAAVKRPAIGPLILVYFLVTLGFANLEGMFSQFNADYLKLGQAANGWVFVSIGVTLAVVNGGLIRPLSKRFGSAPVLKFSLLGLSLAMVVFGFQKSLNPGMSVMVWVLVVSVPIGFFNGLTNPSLLTLISNATEADSQGGMMGVAASSASLGRIVGPIVGGLVYDAIGPRWPFIVGGVLIVVGWLALLPQRFAFDGPLRIRDRQTGEI